MQHQVVPVKTYANVLIALVILLAVSILAAEIEHDMLNLMVALAIALVKAGLIVYFFMQLRFAIPVVRLAAVASLLWLVIMLVLTMSDYLTRS